MTIHPRISEAAVTTRSIDTDPLPPTDTDLIPCTTTPCPPLTTTTFHTASTTPQT